MTDEIERIITPMPDDYDPYGKDASKLGPGGEVVYRIENGVVSALTPEEAEFRRGPKKAKPKTNKRGNRWL